MIKMFVKEFCTRYGTIPNTKTRLRYALIITIDVRGRRQDDFVVSRKCLPEGIKIGERISFINSTREGEK